MKLKTWIFTNMLCAIASRTHLSNIDLAELAKEIDEILSLLGEDPNTQIKETPPISGFDKMSRFRPD